MESINFGALWCLFRIVLGPLAANIPNFGSQFPGKWISNGIRRRRRPHMLHAGPKNKSLSRCNRIDGLIDLSVGAACSRAHKMLIDRIANAMSQ